MTWVYVIGCIGIAVQAVGFYIVVCYLDEIQSILESERDT